MDKLKPCPFCGGEAELGELFSLAYVVCCKECHAVQHLRFNTKKEAVESWNKQVTEPVRYGKWLIEAHKEKTNTRWNVTAECSKCAYDLGEIWGGFFPSIPDGIAEDVCLNCAKSVDLHNYCPNCGARMDGE